jgi:thiamine-phosphate pyrophosphorylase
MTRRQSLPQQWLILDETPSEDMIMCLPRGSGILMLGSLAPKGVRRLRQLSRGRRVTVIAEGRGTAERVHNQRELTRAMLRKTALILVSPMYPTQSHPDWKPLPRMRAAALARLAKRQALALGGMNRERYAKIAQLGFIGWAGISAFRT